MHKDILKTIREKSKYKGLITPCYDGLSLANIPNTILEHFKAKAPNSVLDRNAFDYSLLKNVKHVVVLVIDGLGYHQLLESSRRNQNLTLKNNFVMPLTSVCPSSTASALTTLNTALTPSQHGLVGYRLFLKEFTALTSILKFKAAHAQYDFTQLGINPREFFSFPTIYQRLKKVGVHGTTVFPGDIADSGLSAMTHEGAECIPYITTADMCTQLRIHLQKQKKKSFTYVYHPHIDTISHSYGKHTQSHEAELANLNFSLTNEILENHFKDTLLLITADHGHINGSKNKSIDLYNHEKLLQNLVFPPTGELRWGYLHCKNGKLNEVKRYCESNFGNKVMILESQKMLSLLGNAPVARATLDRIGDLL